MNTALSRGILFSSFLLLAQSDNLGRALGRAGSAAHALLIIDMSHVVLDVDRVEFAHLRADAAADAAGVAQLLDELALLRVRTLNRVL